jgi:exopolyphosphatase / guanosine-5'-triphosphate,3'-diphosphate pyrophosphatase
MPETCWAALDIGSNTVMTLVARGTPGALREDDEWRATTRLGQGVDRTGRLAPDAEERTLAAIAEQTAECRRRYPAGVGVAVATSAARDACNGRAFLARSAELVGGLPVLLSGTEEARFTFQGIVSDLPRGRAVVHLDVGGGSSELTAGIAGEGCLSAESVDLGCVRLGERFSLLDVAAPAAVAAARQTIRATLEPACRRALALAAVAGAGVILSGGSATTYAAMQLGLRVYAAARVHGSPGRTADLDEALPRLFAMTAAERAALPSVTVGRAPVLPAGLLILCEFLHLCGAESFCVSTRGLRFGLVQALAAGTVPPTWQW